MPTMRSPETLSDEVRARYAAARSVLPDAGSVTLLLPVRPGYLLVSGDDSGPSAAMALDLDASALAAGVLHRTPPTAVALERAIALIEDAVMPAVALPSRGTRLMLAAAELRAVLAHADPADPSRATHQAIEALYRRLAAIALGQPIRHDPSLPLQPAFVSALLFVRECMHHLDFEDAVDAG